MRPSDRRHRPRRQRERPRPARARRYGRRARPRPRQGPPRLRRTRRAAHPCHPPGRPARPHRGTGRDPHGVHRDGIDRDRGRPAADRDQVRRRDLLDRAGTRLSVLNTSADCLGINQRAHYSIDQFAASTAVPYSTIRPATSPRRCSPGTRCARLAHLDRPGRQRPEGADRPSRRGRGRAARAHRPGAVGRAPRPDRTGPPVMAGSAGAAVGRTGRARHLGSRPRRYLDRLTGAGIPAGTAELLITREWAILAGENDYTTSTSAGSPADPRARWPSSSTTTARNSPDAPASPPAALLAAAQLMANGSGPPGNERRNTKALANELSHRRPELRSVLHAAGQLLATAGQQAIEENDRPAPPTIWMSRGCSPRRSQRSAASTLSSTPPPARSPRPG